MGVSLRDALVKAGVVTEAQAKAAEKAAEEERKKNSAEEKVKRLKERMNSYPSNRLGKPFAYIEWFTKRTLPQDAHRTCFHCGELSMDAIDAAAALLDDTGQEKINFLEWMEAQRNKALEIGKSGKFLRAMPLLIGLANPAAHSFFVAKKVMPVCCTACLKFELVDLDPSIFPLIPKEVYDPLNQK